MSVVYIGGGVSTIFSVLNLLNNGFDGSKITILEAGPDIYERKEENTLKGFGGAGTFSDGKFLFSLHSGGFLDKYTGEIKAYQLFDKVKQILLQFYPGKKEDIYISGIEEVPVQVTEAGLEVKQSEVWHIGTTLLAPIMLKIREFLKKSRVKIYCDFEVKDINFSQNLIFGKEPHETFTYDKLIIAAGKYGIPFLQKIINKYSLKTIPKPAQFGIRFESEDKYFYQLLKSSYDFKLYKKYGDEISIRTFCTNSDDAYVVIEDYNSPDQKEEYFTVNGHSYRDPAKHNGKINFGILMEMKFHKKNINPLEYCQRLAKKCNGINKSIKYVTPSMKIPTINSEQIPKDLFYNFYNEEIAEYFYEFISRLQQLFSFKDDYLFYLPEIKFLTNELVVNYEDLSLIDYPNVYINGDSLSARGIVVSASQGIYTSESFLK